MLALAGAALHFFELSFDFNGLGHFLRKNRNVRVVWLGARAEGYAMSKTTMKLSLGLCASLIGFGVIPSSASLGQSGWFWQNPLPLGNSLYAVSVLDSDTVTAVGADGTILRTTDGGATWERLEP